LYLIIRLVWRQFNIEIKKLLSKYNFCFYININVNTNFLIREIDINENYDANNSYSVVSITLMFNVVKLVYDITFCATFFTFLTEKRLWNIVIFFHIISLFLFYYISRWVYFWTEFVFIIIFLIYILCRRHFQ